MDFGEGLQQPHVVSPTNNAKGCYFGKSLGVSVTSHSEFNMSHQQGFNDFYIWLSTRVLFCLDEHEWSRMTFGKVSSPLHNVLLRVWGYGDIKIFIGKIIFMLHRHVVIWGAFGVTWWYLYNVLPRGKGYSDTHDRHSLAGDGIGHNHSECILILGEALDNLCNISPMISGYSDTQRNKGIFFGFRVTYNVSRQHTVWSQESRWNNVRSTWPLPDTYELYRNVRKAKGYFLVFGVTCR